jgi:hypothetical protein
MRGPLKGAKFKLGSMAGHGGGASVYFGLVESEQLKQLTHYLHSGCTFYDIGGNVGLYTILASRLVGHRESLYR